MKLTLDTNDENDLALLRSLFGPGFPYEVEQVAAPTPAPAPAPAPAKRGPGRPPAAAKANSAAAPPEEIDYIAAIKIAVGRLGQLSSPLEAANTLRTVSGQPNLSSIPVDKLPEVLTVLNSHVEAAEQLQ